LKAAFLWQRRITSWQQVLQQQRQRRQQRQLVQQERQQQQMRQQLVQVQVQVLQLALALVLVLLLSCRKQPEQQLQRSLPKRVTCSFFDSLMNVRKQFFRGGQPKAVVHCSGRRIFESSSSPTTEYIRINPWPGRIVC